MASKKPVTLFKRFIHEIANKGNGDAVKKYCSRHFVEHQPTPPSAPNGRDQIRAYFAMMRQGLPDLTIVFDDAFEADGKVVARTTWTGTHQGELFGIPATGKPVAFRAIDIVRFEGNKMVEHWNVTDRAAVSMQLGSPASQNIFVRTTTKSKRAARAGRSRPRTSRAASSMRAGAPRQRAR